MNAKQVKSSTKESLIDAAIRVFSTRPSASLSDVAEEAGVKRITLHRLIGSRYDLLQAIAIRSLADMESAVQVAVQKESSATAMLRATIAALVPVADRCHFLWQNPSIWESDHLAKEIKRQQSELRELIDQVKLEGGISADLPNAWIIALIDAIIYAALTAARSGDIAVNDAAGLAVRTLFQGIEANSPTTKKIRKR